MRTTDELNAETMRICRRARIISCVMIPISVLSTLCSAVALYLSLRDLGWFDK
jgi:hypothetical protein